MGLRRWSWTRQCLVQPLMRRGTRVVRVAPLVPSLALRAKFSTLVIEGRSGQVAPGGSPS